MGVMYKLDSTGHGEVSKWGDDDDSRAAGDAAFKALAKKNFTMFDVTDKQAGRMLDRFDPKAEEIIAVPRMKGG